MVVTLQACTTWASVAFGFASAIAWLYASVVKVTREQVVAQRSDDAARRGEKPNLAGITLDGWDMSATFAAQSKWSVRGAILAACAIGLQAITQVAANV